MRKASWFGVNPCNCGAQCAVSCETVFDGSLFYTYNAEAFNSAWEIKGQPAPTTNIDLTMLDPWSMVCNLGISLYGATLVHNTNNDTPQLGYRYRICVEVLDQDNYLFAEQYINEGINGGSEYQLGEVRQGIETRYGQPVSDFFNVRLHDFRLCYSNSTLVLNTLDTNVTDPIAPIVQTGVESTQGTQSGLTMSDWAQMPFNAFDNSIGWQYHYNGNLAEGCPVCDQ